MATRFYKVFFVIILLSILAGACMPVTPQPPAPGEPPAQKTQPPAATQPLAPQPTKPPTTAPTATTPPTATPPGLQAVDDGAPLPPVVVRQQPQGGAELPAGQPVELTFDQPMDAGKTAAALRVDTPEGKPLPGKISWPNAKTLRFEPGGKLQSGALYFASLGTEAVSAEGVALAEPYTFEFQASGDLQVSQVFPAPGASNVDSEAVITVIFNRPVAALVIAEESANLPSPIAISPDLPGKGEWVNTSVYAFRPDKGYLRSGTTYQATVKAGLKDATGESSLAQDYTWQFSTAAPGIDFFTLSERQYNPDSGYNKVLLDDYFTVQFLQPMDHPSVEAAISLDGGPSVGFKFKWSADSLSVVITPTQRLALGTTYTFHVGQGAQAENGGTLVKGLDWKFTTVPPPAIVGVSPADDSQGGHYTSEFRLEFASPMRLDTVKDHIQITPQPEKDVEWYYNEWDWSITGWFLKPSTKYEIRLLPGMQDIYGNSIQKEQVVRFTTGKRDPEASLRMPYDTPILRAGGSAGAPPEAQEFYVGYTNVSKVDLALSRLTTEQFLAFQNGQTKSYEYRPADKDIVWKDSLPGNAAQDERTLKAIRPNQNGQPLGPGFYFLSLTAPEVQHTNPYVDFRLLIVANANLTFKTSHTEGLVWVTNLETGRPVSGAAARFYNAAGELIGQAVAAPDGQAFADLPEQKDLYEARYALVDDGQTFAFAQSQWGSGISLYDYGIWTDYYSPAYEARAYVYTERPIYRPGQPVYFKGIVRIDDDLNYKLPADSQVKVKISSYKEDVTELELPLTSQGTFNGKLLLDPEADLGYYTLDVYLTGDPNRSVGSITFNVAEYRKPEFQVNVQASPANLLAGDPLTARVQADYYSGGGVSGAKVQWTLTAQAYAFQPPDEFSGYSFANYEDDVYRYEGESGGSSRQLAEGEGQTGPDGSFSYSLPASLGDNGASQALVFEATLTDLAQTAVSGRASVIAHRSLVYPGLRARAYVGVEGKEQTFDLAALDWDGKPIANQSLSVEIVERRWYSVQEQDANGRVTWKSTVEETPVTKFVDVKTDAQGKTSVQYTPPHGGVYRAYVTGLDAKGNPGKASAYQWVAGKDYIPWRQTNDRSFDLVTDKKSYQPGETAQVLIASPFQGEAYALVTVERGRIRYREVVPLDGNSTIYKLRLTPDLAPNAYISVIVVKGMDENNPRPNFKMGVTQIQVDPGQKALKVQITPDRSQVGPGEQVTYAVRTLDASGSPVSAEVSLSLSDLATLSLLPPNSPPIMDYFYARRSLSVWTAVGIVQNIDEFNQDIKDEIQEGMASGSGGGKGVGDLGVVEVRQNFPDTAFWDAQVQTNNDGEASVVVTLPDNLTTWRMDARAVADGTRVGQTTVDIVSTRPLLVRPQTPRFFVANDQATLGAAVHNNTAENLSVTVALQAEGLQAQSPLSQTLTIPAGQKAFVTWEVTAPLTSTRADLIFSAIGGGYQDASRPPQGTLDNQGLPIYRYEAPETVGTSGQLLSEGAKVEGILLPQTMQAAAGQLTIRLQPSLAASMTDSLTYLKQYPYECVEQTVSRFLPNVLATQAMRAAGLNDPDLEKGLSEQVQTALQRLYSSQNADGGWGWWGEGKSDPQVSAYVILGLVEAKAAGYSADGAVIDRGLNYLRLQIEPLDGLKDPYKLNRQAFLLYVLARSGKPDASSAGQLYEQRQRMQIYAQAFLAHALYWIDPADPRLPTLLADFNSQAVVSATGTHWEEKTADVWNWNSDTRTTAIVLSALSQIDSKNPLNANAVRWLMSHRTDGHWLGTQETAWTLMALTHWMSASGELQANYAYAVGLNGTTLGSGLANRDTLRQTTELTVDIHDLLQSELNRLAFTRDGGPGNLYYTAHLKVSLPVEQIQPLDRGMALSRSYYRLDNLNTPVSEAQQGELLLARLTLVTPHALHYVVVDDPLPAGLEGVDQSLNTSPQSAEVPQVVSQQDLFWRGWGWWNFDHIQYRDEKVTLSASYLPAGTYVYTYLVRAGTPGQFRVIPPTGQEFYFPEVYGRGAGSLFTVKP